MIEGNEVFINGDGETSRDFCYVDNAVQANLLAATTQNPDAVNQVYNVALGDRTSLNDLYKLILANLLQHRSMPPAKLSYRDFRAGDVRHSLADITKAYTLLGYAPTIRVGAGVAAAMPWYISKVALK